MLSTQQIISTILGNSSAHPSKILKKSIISKPMLQHPSILPLWKPHFVNHKISLKWPPRPRAEFNIQACLSVPYKWHYQSAIYFHPDGPLQLLWLKIKHCGKSEDSPESQPHVSKDLILLQPTSLVHSISASTDHGPQNSFRTVTLSSEVDNKDRIQTSCTPLWIFNIMAYHKTISKPLNGTTLI